MIKDIETFIRNGRNNLSYLLNDELRQHYSEEEKQKINSKLEDIENEYRANLQNSTSRSDFLKSFSEIKNFYIEEPKSANNKIWNQLVEELMIKLFYIFIDKFALTANEAFIYHVFHQTKVTFNNLIEHNYFYKYISQNGKVGLNNLSLYARDFIRRQIKKKQEIDLKIFLFYFKERYKLTDLIIVNLDVFVGILRDNLNNFAVERSHPLISHYLSEFKYEDDLAPKLESYEHNKQFYYLFLRQKLKECLRESENQLREKLGYKSFGEGHINEHSLYLELTKIIDPVKIKRRYRPKWLNGLELDFYFELKGEKLAVEYQGAQHSKVIPYFGGITAFKKQISRDRRKLKLCHANEVKLHYCYFDDSIKEFVKERFFGKR